MSDAAVKAAYAARRQPREGTPAWPNRRLTGLLGIEHPIVGF